MTRADVGHPRGGEARSTIATSAGAGALLAGSVLAATPVTAAPTVAATDQALVACWYATSPGRSAAADLGSRCWVQQLDDGRRLLQRHQDWRPVAVDQGRGGETRAACR